ncbi:uncharacterized protein KGF55_003124 [Candida pseudojiufengensis]|uniref:uncharacterized protein n=1 Tax=Candida pseudojiufengensis TaxID=497109 RepID=UPI0022258BD9|nr:uncharacterized protein KGF55_003124 [Candida pseudojiufengensis]KAI5963332.1 hypothetical protein KGF55_003124 [Candida pseudojiufengensis]
MTDPQRLQNDKLSTSSTTNNSTTISTKYNTKNPTSQTTSPLISPNPSRPSSSYTANPIPTKLINFDSLDESVIRHHQNTTNTPNNHNHNIFDGPPSTTSNSFHSSSINSKTSPVNSTKNSKTPPPSSIPSLDDLVNDCFLLSIDKLDEDNRINICNQFHEFLIKQHCQENLEFLIDIYRYEYTYNLKILSSSTIPSNLSPTSKTDSFINNTSNHFYIDNISKIRLNNSPSPIDNGSITNNNSTKAATNLSLRHGKTSSMASLDSMFKKNQSQQQSLKLDDLDDPQNAFVSTIDDLDINQPWDNFKQKFVNDDEDDDDYEDDIGIEMNGKSPPQNEEDEGKILYINDEDLNQLNTKWDFLMNEYIKNDSPKQINISQKLFKEIVEESSITKLHNPLILIKAKNEVIRMLKENGYFEFLNLCKKNQQQNLNSVKSGNSSKKCECGLTSINNCINGNDHKDLRTQCLNKNLQSNIIDTTTKTKSSSNTSSLNVSPIISPNQERGSRTPNQRSTPQQFAHQKGLPDIESNSFSLPSSILGRFSSSSKRINKPQEIPSNNISSPTTSSSTPIIDLNSPETSTNHHFASSSNSSSLSNLLGHLKLNGNIAPASDSPPISSSSYDSTSSINSNNKSINHLQNSTRSIKNHQTGNYNHNHNFLHHNHHNHNSKLNSNSPNNKNFIADINQFDKVNNRSNNSSPISIESGSDSRINNNGTNTTIKREIINESSNSSSSNQNSSSLSSSLKFWRRKN